MERSWQNRLCPMQTVCRNRSSQVTSVELGEEKVSGTWILPPLSPLNCTAWHQNAYNHMWFNIYMGFILIKGGVAKDES